MNLRVVPEFSTFTTSSGVFGEVPAILRERSRCSMVAPMALQAAMVAFVSRDKRTLEMVDSPCARLAMSAARWE